MITISETHIIWPIWYPLLGSSRNFSPGEFRCSVLLRIWVTSWKDPTLDIFGGWRLSISPERNQNLLCSANFAPFKMLGIWLLRQVERWKQVNYGNFCNQTVQFYTKQYRRRITDCDVNVMLSKITFRKEIFDLRHNFQQRQMKALSGATVNSVLKIFRIICFEFWKSSFFSMLN